MNRTKLAAAASMAVLAIGATGVGEAHAGPGVKPSQKTIVRAFQDNMRWCVTPDAKRKKEVNFREGFCGGWFIPDKELAGGNDYQIGVADHQCVFAVQYDATVSKACVTSTWHLFTQNIAP